VGELVDLSTEECWKLVEGREFARLAWNSATGPIVLPVNFVVHEHAIWMRTTAYSAIAEEVDESQIAVEMDDINQETHDGWSVLLRGRAEVLYHENQVPDAVHALHTWPAGVRPLWVRLRPDIVTGRRLQ
jgi:nitroimidazol reductase NimA-like FMN-containing flavoprotein (pyridoxamine 5'-phosphate oxidase superfamily)